MERLDFINDELRKQGHSIQTFKDVESAMHEYYLVFGKTLDPMPRPTLSQFYTPTEAQKDREIAFIVFGLSAVAIYSYSIMHKPGPINTPCQAELYQLAMCADWPSYKWIWLVERLNMCFSFRQMIG